MKATKIVFLWSLQFAILFAVDCGRASAEYELEALTVGHATSCASDKGDACGSKDCAGCFGGGRGLGCGHAACCCRDLCARFDTGGTVCHTWMVRADAMFLNFTGDDDVPLLFDEAKNAFDGPNLNPGASWGPRLSLIRCLNENRSLELAYFGTDSWAGGATVAGDLAVRFPSTPLPPIPPTETGVATFNQDTEFYSVEANLLFESCNWWTLLAGFRYVEFNQNFDMSFTTGGLTSVAAIDADNRLYGFQVGGQGSLWERGALRLDGWMKGGIYANNASQSTFEELGTLMGPPLSISVSTNKGAFLGELGLGGTYQLTNHLAFRAGYQALWLEGIALSRQQIDNTNLIPPQFAAATVDTNHGVFLHGGYVGFELTH